MCNKLQYHFTKSYNILRKKIIEAKVMIFIAHPWESPHTLPPRPQAPPPHPLPLPLPQSHLTPASQQT